MKNNRNKGNFILVEDFFSENLRSELPVNAFLLRTDSSKESAFDGRLYANSKIHRSNKYIVSYFYKSISNTF